MAAPPPPKPKFEKVKAIYSYIAQADTELSFDTEEIIKVIDKNYDSEGWWYGEIEGTEGYFPSSYVEPYKQAHGYTPKKTGVPKKSDMISRLTQQLAASGAGLFGDEAVSALHEDYAALQASIQASTAQTLSTVQSQPKDKSSEEAKIAELTKELRELQKRLVAEAQQRQELKDQIAILKAPPEKGEGDQPEGADQLEKLQIEVTELRKFNSQLSDDLTRQEAQYNKAADDLFEKTEQFDKLTQTTALLTTENDELKTQLQKIALKETTATDNHEHMDKLVSELVDLRKQNAELTELKKQSQELTELKSLQNTLNLENRQLTNSIHEKENSVQALKTQLNDELTQHQQLKKTVEALNDEIKSQLQQLEDHNTKTKDMETNINQLNETVNQLNSQLNQLNKENQQLKTQESKNLPEQNPDPERKKLLSSDKHNLDKDKTKKHKDKTDPKKDHKEKGESKQLENLQTELSEMTEKYKRTLVLLEKERRERDDIILKVSKMQNKDLEMATDKKEGTKKKKHGLFGNAGKEEIASLEGELKNYEMLTQKLSADREQLVLMNRALIQQLAELMKAGGKLSAIGPAPKGPPVVGPSPTARLNASQRGPAPGPPPVGKSPAMRGPPSGQAPPPIKPPTVEVVPPIATPTSDENSPQQSPHVDVDGKVRSKNSRRNSVGHASVKSIFKADSSDPPPNSPSSPTTPNPSVPSYFALQFPEALKNQLYKPETKVLAVLEKETAKYSLQVSDFDLYDFEGKPLIITESTTMSEIQQHTVYLCKSGTPWAAKSSAILAPATNERRPSVGEEAAPTDTKKLKRRSSKAKLDHVVDKGDPGKPAEKDKKDKDKKDKPDKDKKDKKDKDKQK